VRWWISLRWKLTYSLADAEVVAMIHDPPRAPGWLVRAYPSHLHINLLPRLQGQGCGRHLLAAWCSRAKELGSAGFHLGVSSTNSPALNFYKALGWQRLISPEVEQTEDVLWFGKIAATTF
jgi:ribosomal protein S18 acetylase RimI-like enzyme